MRQQFSQFRNATYINPARHVYILPAFLLPVPVWAGASTLIAQYELSNSTPISIRAPVAEFGENFMVAVRWITDGQYINRFKFWDNDLGVLLFPIYNSERIGTNAVIEIWSIDSASAPELDADVNIESSILVFPAGSGSSINVPTCCSQPSESITLVASEPVVLPPNSSCNPFCVDNLCTF